MSLLDRVRRPSEEDLAQVVLEQERIRHPETREQPDDVAVEENRLPAARGGIRPVLQVHFVDDDELRVLGVAGLRRAEEPEERPVQTKHARQLVGQYTKF